MDKKVIHDISVLLGEESIEYPGDEPFCRKVMNTIPEDGHELSILRMSSHAGTHIDAPSHFRQGYRSIDGFKAEEFIIPAQVIEIQNKQVICPSELLGVRERCALLFKTENSRSGKSCSGVFSEDYVCLTIEAAEICVKARALLVGIDYISVEQSNSETYPVHQLLLGNNIPLLEGLSLSEVLPGAYTLICLPLKIKNGEASPVRAVLME
jgi:arylformamidase